KRAKALEPRLAKLTIQVSPTADLRGLELRRDAVLFGRPAWGVATPIDPGRHTIEAKAPGKKTWTTTITVEARGSGAVVTIPVLEDGSAEATLPAAAPVARASGAEPTGPRAPEADASPGAASSADTSEGASSGKG